MEKLFEEADKIHVKEIIKDEFDIIKRESRELLCKDCLYNLYGLIDYLNLQKRHLNSIKSKIGNNDIQYLEASTFVVKVGLFDIGESVYFHYLHLVQVNTPVLSLSNYSSINVGSNYGDPKKIWEAVKVLDQFPMLYSFKYDVYQPKRREIEKQCYLHGADVRTPEQVKKDKRRDFWDDIIDNWGCCLILIVVYLFLVLIGVIK